MATGFSFGLPTTQTTGGLGTPGSTGGLGGAKPGFGTSTTTASGFSLGGQTGGTGGFSFSQTQTTKPVGIALGAPAATQATSGFNLGATTQPASTGLGGGLGAGLGGGLGAATTASTGATTGFKLGGGLTLGAPATTSTTGFSLGATTTATTGLTLGAASATAKPGFSLTGATPALGGGLGGTTTSTGAATTTSSALLGGLLGATPATQAAKRGLGGVDPKTTTSGSSNSGQSGKPGDSKAVKESMVPQPICVTVEEFKKYVKSQKSERESIARMSSKPMYKVQEEYAQLKELLALVSNGLQRNASSIEKLKSETAQELKYAEVAQRTKDTPPGLQYENTAPSEFFQHMVEDFEVRMVLYRQQIEEMESHLSSLNNGAILTPHEMSLLLAKLHESFVSLAAQLQVVHEAVKTQKEHYLNYRKVFHGETGDIFEKRKKVADKKGVAVMTTTVGPTPFTGMSNAAAVAMASAMNRTQNPAAAVSVAPAAFGAGASGTNIGGFGSTGMVGGSGTSLFGNKPLAGSTLGGGFGTQPGGGGSAFNFGSTPQTATVKPLG